MGLLSVSSTFDCDPTETYIFFPSRENTMSRVQCPPPRSNPPPGRLGTITSRGPRAFRSPFWYGKRTTESVFATKTYLGFAPRDRKSTRLNSSHGSISYAVFCLKKKISGGDEDYAMHVAMLAELC